jgi:hypothetical protein
MSSKGTNGTINSRVIREDRTEFGILLEEYPIIGSATYQTGCKQAKEYMETSLKKHKDMNLNATDLKKSNGIVLESYQEYVEENKLRQIGPFLPGQYVPSKLSPKDDDIYCFIHNDYFDLQLDEEVFEHDESIGGADGCDDVYFGSFETCPLNKTHGFQYELKDHLILNEKFDRAFMVCPWYYFPNTDGIHTGVVIRNGGDTGMAIYTVRDEALQTSEGDNPIIAFRIM